MTPEQSQKYMRTSYRKRKVVTDALKDAPCSDCGGRFPPECMDFDHRPGTEKFRGVSKLARYRLEVLLAEVEKCDLVCANCHRIRTARRGR